MDATALFRFQSGLYVVSANDSEHEAACLVNTGLQVTAEPLQVEVVINKENYTEGVVERAGHFCICPITKDADMLYIGRFGFKSSADVNKFEGLDTQRTSLGDPYDPAMSACYVACKTVKTLDVGTHMIFVGEVVDAEPLSNTEPMTYTYYHTTLKGKTPKKASSFIAV